MAGREGYEIEEKGLTRPRRLPVRAGWLLALLVFHVVLQRQQLPVLAPRATPIHAVGGQALALRHLRVEAGQRAHAHRDVLYTVTLQLEPFTSPHSPKKKGVRTDKASFRCEDTSVTESLVAISCEQTLPRNRS